MDRNIFQGRKLCYWFHFFFSYQKSLFCSILSFSDNFLHNLNCSSQLPYPYFYKIILHSFCSFVELKNSFNSVDKVGGFYVFDIGGNKLRLIAIIHFSRQKIYITDILDHKEYDKQTWKKSGDTIIIAVTIKLQPLLAEANKHWKYAAPFLLILKMNMII